MQRTQNVESSFSCAPITKTVASQTAYILNCIGYKAQVIQHSEEISMKLIVNNVYISRIIEGCNSISVIILFISFIVAFSAKFIITALYILFGSLIIYTVNVFRIVFISIGLLKYPEYQDVLHDLIFPTIIYGITFILWFVWVTKFSKLKK